jgi:response regulator of citrate/malate metabolism
MSLDSLRAVVVALRGRPEGLSAGEAGEAIGVSRVTARRYLEHLADEGRVTRAPRYGGAGRPEVGYVWAKDGPSDGPSDGAT